MSNKSIIVTAGIIRRSNTILIAQRKKDSWLEPSKWEFPGGKVENSENLEDCLIREIKEELDIDISVSKLFMKHSHVYYKDNKKIPITLMTYLADWNKGEVKNIDCQKSRWIHYDELVNFDFAEADKTIVKELLTYNKQTDFKEGI